MYSEVIYSYYVFLSPEEDNTKIHSLTHSLNTLRNKEYILVVITNDNISIFSDSNYCLKIQAIKVSEK